MNTGERWSARSAFPAPMIAGRVSLLIVAPRSVLTTALTGTNCVCRHTSRRARANFAASRATRILDGTKAPCGIG